MKRAIAAAALTLGCSGTLGLQVHSDELCFRADGETRDEFPAFDDELGGGAGDWGRDIRASALCPHRIQIAELTGDKVDDFAFTRWINPTGPRLYTITLNSLRIDDLRQSDESCITMERHVWLRTVLAHELGHVLGFVGHGGDALMVDGLPRCTLVLPSPGELAAVD